MKTKKKKSIVSDNPVCMSYDTYIYLRDLIEVERNTLRREFIKAHEFIPPQPFKKGVISNREVAGDIYRERDKVFTNMLTELRFAAAESNRHNPNKELRKFWEVNT